ncbi:MAG: hypothetical protein FRX49_06269 [Trebouxia sp. A1-2]|nr:MAG: hypothetical protein FRX49_06269 [Trebouxia sp. A1-2]
MASTAKVPLARSPSLLDNNLSASNNDLAYCHNDQGQGQKLLQQACLISFKDQLAVVHTTTHGLQVWDISMQQLLFQWDLPTGAPAQAITSALYCRGIALVESEDNACLLCVGSSTGKIHTFIAGSAAQIEHHYDLCHHTSPIAALASGHTSSTTTNHIGSHLASCDDNGAITVFQAKSAGGFETKHEWEGHGVPCIAVACKSSTLIAAFCDGSVRLYSMDAGMLKTELQAHSRMLSAMAVHPTRPLFATAAEDATMAVWQMLDADQEVDCKWSACWNNALITGIAFTGRANDVAAAAYFSDEICIWTVT